VSVSRLILATLAGALLLAQDRRLDKSAVMAEPDLEKRSEKALQLADQLLDTARASYKQGDWKQVEAALDEVREAVDLCLQSLRDSGKRPRRNPKYFKRAELKTRELGRRLESFSHEVMLDERPAVDQVKQRVHKVHEDLLNAVMGRDEWEKR
jgi:hypothetical protein